MQNPRKTSCCMGCCMGCCMVVAWLLHAHCAQQPPHGVLARSLRMIMTDVAGTHTCTCTYAFKHTDAHSGSVVSGKNALRSSSSYHDMLSPPFPPNAFKHTEAHSGWEFNMRVFPCCPHLRFAHNGKGIQHVSVLMLSAFQVTYRAAA